ncbi:biosynthetic-type acetolactate synthase large subunit [Legionella brunensis]|nr:biosynthetic-type acetolactate synthase large subunit [Legionella brunensis]
MNSMKMSGAQAILESLIYEKVDLVFGYPGGAIMPLYDALYEVHSKIHHVLVRHEQGAAHAAEGYARTMGRAGVCIATSGPGATNLITGIADAMLDSVPLICLTGQVASPFLGKDAFQEADIVGMTLAVTKWSFQVTQTAEIPLAMAKAFYFAQTGRPGPVLVDITKDAQLGFLDFAYQKFLPPKVLPYQISLKDEEMQCAVKLINQAKRPYLLVGHGVLLSQGEKELLHFAEKTGIPVACTLLGLSAFPPDHPLYVGMLGMHGNYGANLLTNEADVLIAVGMRFDDRVTGNLKRYAKQAKVIHIDIDPSEVSKNVPVHVALIADAKKALEQLTMLVETNQHDDWLEQFKSCYKEEFAQVISNEIQPTSEKIKMGEVVHLLSRKTHGQAILVTDVGQHQMVVARYYQFMRNNSHITSGGLGAMGFALPAAIGAKFAAKDREVVAVIGDGGFQMTIQELGVINQEHLAVKIIILNNSYLGMVRQWQELFFEERYSCTSLQNPDFIKIAAGYGIRARRVESREQLEQAIDEMLASKEAYLLDIVVEQHSVVFPIIPSGAGVDEVRLS